MAQRPLVLLVQLPIPPHGPALVRGNVPLAVACLALFARRSGLEDFCRIELLPAEVVDCCSEQGIVEAILAREPWLVGFTCYLWNIERTLWIAEQLKRRGKDIRIVVGGPEITADNAWVLAQPTLDYAVLGEGEQTFAALVAALRDGADPAGAIDGLWVRPGGHPLRPRTPLANLDSIASPYLEGILDASRERLMFLETARGCAFRCRYCYYPGSYERVCLLSPEQVAANLAYAARCGVKEVVLLDPTLNGHRDFHALLHVLARCNPERQFTYAGELRAESVTPETVRLMREAHFGEVEVGLQSVGRPAQELMDRRVDPQRLERGVRAMLDAGIRVKVDLIVGLPGDTADDVRRGIELLATLRPAGDMQVFPLAVLPGTAFRHEAGQLGLRYQERPPYGVLGTPTLSLEEMSELMDEAQDALGVEFDPLPPPYLDGQGGGLSASAVEGSAAFAPLRCAKIDLDAGPAALPPPAERGQFFVLWLRSADFAGQRAVAEELIGRVLADNPHTTLQVVLEPTEHPERLSPAVIEPLLVACFRTCSYLDRAASLHPGQFAGAKRLVVRVRESDRERLGPAWVDAVESCATLAWRGRGAGE